ncbi:MAG TPA: hypothetical protein DEQ68_09700 [Ruminococcaceae bacterium]|nr:hypothetical protein [Oscillospiraceae bacterium]
MEFAITTGKVETAKKVVIYGPEGIGKSTLAAQFPNPLFIDTEGSTKELDVARLPAPTSWEMLNQEVDYVKQTRPCATLIIDTIDWAEAQCLAHICAKNGKTSIEEFGYGNGWTYEKEEFGRFLNRLGEVVNAGIHVVLTAHAVLRKFEQPDELGSYDRWELKLGKKTTNYIAPLVKEWADMVLFANYKTIAVAVDKDGKKHKGQGGKTRIINTTHHACWDAKNRYGLPDEIPMDYAQIAHIFGNPAPAVPVAPAPEPAPAAEPAPAPEPAAVPEKPAEMRENGIPKALADLMKASGITEEQICKACAMKGYFPENMPISDYPEDFVNGVLIGAWEQIVDFIKSDYPF